MGPGRAGGDAETRCVRVALAVTAGVEAMAPRVRSTLLDGLAGVGARQPVRRLWDVRDWACLGVEARGPDGGRGLFVGKTDDCAPSDRNRSARVCHKPISTQPARRTQRSGRPPTVSFQKGCAMMLFSSAR